MAARLRNVPTEETRAKIQASQLINRLSDHALKNTKMKNSQIRAALGLLAKVIPDLSSQELKLDGEIRNRVISAAAVTPAEWAAQHSNGSNGKANGSGDRLGTANGTAESTD